MVQWCTRSGDKESLSSLPFSHIHPITPESDSTQKSTLPSTSSALFLNGFQSSDDEEEDGVCDEVTEVPDHKVRFDLGEVMQVGEATTNDACESSSTPTPSDIDPLGDWEAHTRGIGSRLLRQMGYSGVGGLGRHGTGRRLPVAMDTNLHQIVLEDVGPLHRPSLDRLVELKEEAREGVRKRARRKGKQRTNTREAGESSSSASDFHEGSVFDFLNNRILGTIRKEKKIVPKRDGSTVAAPGKKTGRELNVELYNLQVSSPTRSAFYNTYFISPAMLTGCVI